MANQVTNYKCPACTGPLHYDGNSGKLACEYCDSKFEIEEIEALYQKEEEKEWDASDISDDWGEDAQKMKTYSCPSCGAELICDAETAATACPYCGNPTIIPGQFAGGLKPDYIIPFKLDQKAAEKALKEH